jgi:hypothetical protein
VLLPGTKGLRAESCEKPTIDDYTHFRPTNTSGLHGHTAHAFLDQPPRRLTQICGKTSETPHRLRVAIRADGHPMLAATTSIPAASGCTISSAFQSTLLDTDPFCLPVGFFVLMKFSLLQSGIVDSARFRIVNKKLSKGSDPQLKTATDRQTNPGIG